MLVKGRIVCGKNGFKVNQHVELCSIISYHALYLCGALPKAPRDYPRFVPVGQ